MYADIALIKLQKPVKCAAALYNKGHLPLLDSTGSGRVEAGKLYTVAGWGTLYSNGPQPDKMRQA